MVVESPRDSRTLRRYVLPHLLSLVPGSDGGKQWQEIETFLRDSILPTLLLPSGLSVLDPGSRSSKVVRFKNVLFSR